MSIINRATRGAPQGADMYAHLSTCPKYSQKLPLFLLPRAFTRFNPSLDQLHPPLCSLDVISSVTAIGLRSIAVRCLPLKVKEKMKLY